MSHRKYWYGLSALAFAVSVVNAAPPLAVPTANPGPPVTADEAGVPGGIAPSNVTALYITGFEAPDWVFDTSICGPTFELTCVGNGPASNACTGDPVVDGNCCDKDPNTETGWFMNGLCRHCNQPHIDNVHPFAGTQHLRAQYDPLGGNPPGCLGSGGACRQRWSAPWDRNQPEINKTTWQYEIAYSHDYIGTTTIVRHYLGNLVNGGGIYVHAQVYFKPGGGVYAVNGTTFSPLGLWTYDTPDYGQVTVEYDPCNRMINYKYAGKPNPFYPTGIFTYSTPLGFTAPYGDYCNYTNGNCTIAHRDALPAYLDSFTWVQTHQNDGQLVDLDNFSITHEGCPDACCNGDTGVCLETLSAIECDALAHGHYYPNVSCAQLGTPGFPPACGMDKGSCCDASPGSGSGVCTDVVQAACPPPGADPRWYTWTRGASCDGYQTLCVIGHGMCSSGPDADKWDGVCENVIPADGVCTPGVCDCIDPPPDPITGDCPPPPTARTNHCSAGLVGALCRRDAQCGPVCTAGLVGNACLVDADCNTSTCTGGLIGNDCLVDADCNNPGYCMTDPTKACVTNDDCTNPGFCYGGLCTPAAIPGHCEYASAGFCQTMGSCVGMPQCEPAISLDGCCENRSDYPAYGCPTLCPSGIPADCVGKVACNAVPGGADCPFCEGCDAWPTVSCINLGQTGECPSPGAGLPAGTCVANALYVCNGNADCPAGASGGVCVFPAVSPGGFLCTDDAQCVIPATQCGPEHTGACCDRETGLCTPDVLSADCVPAPGNQLVWTKLATCAEAGCIRHTGACCDHSPGAGGPGPEGACTNGTYPEDCTGTQKTWHKDELCAAVTCLETLGACCDLITGGCTITLQADCPLGVPGTLVQREWTKEGECIGPNAVSCVAVPGACCDGDTFGLCTQTTDAQCRGGKLHWTKGALCADIECTHEAIPTVSQWGLVVLTLLLLVGAKVYFGRRQSAAA